MESLPQDHATPEGGRPHSSAHSPVYPDCEPFLPGMTQAEAANDVRMSQLARTIEHEIIPRLMLAHRTTSDRVLPLKPPDQPFDAGDVERFTRQVLADDDELAMGSVDAYRAQGVPIESIYLHLLAPTARYLGELWTEDLCDFTDVTIALGRLQRVLRELSPAYGRTVAHTPAGRRALLLPCPGEQHTFGLAMVGEFFRHAGWDVAGSGCDGDTDAAALAGVEWFDVIGFSLGAEIHLDALADAIRAVRHASCNRDIAVVVGGPLFMAFPDYVARVGADGTTIDGRDAPLLAEHLIACQAGERAVARARRTADSRAGSGGR